MKVVGIIAEYNPFHNGHKYQIEYAKNKLNADAVVVVMSGNWVQRGAPAVFDKHNRAMMALSNQADLIIEMPTVASTASAETFATCGVSLLAKTNIIDTLLFSGESCDIELFNDAADALNNETPEFKECLNQKLQEGMSFPLAREYALRELVNLPDSFLASPNNILGIEYIRAMKRLNVSFDACVIQRIESDYHDMVFKGDFASATSIRHFLTTRSLDDASPDKRLDIIDVTIPDNIHDHYLELLNDGVPIKRNDFSSLMQKALLDNDDYSKFYDCDFDLSHKIKNERNNFIEWKAFTEQVKSKNYTYSRISRVLSHILLNITNDDFKNLEKCEYAPYLRILGFNDIGEKVLAELSKKTTIPYICNLAKDEAKLDKTQKDLLDIDIKCSEYYRIMKTQNGQSTYSNEYSIPIVRV